MSAATSTIAVERDLRPRSGAQWLEAVRRWVTVLRALLRKELRDVMWLACGVAAACALLTLGADALFVIIGDGRVTVACERAQGARARWPAVLRNRIDAREQAQPATQLPRPIWMGC